MSLECGRKPKNLEETHTNTGRTYKLLADVILGYHSDQNVPGTNLPAGRFGGRIAHAPAILEDGGAQGEDGRTDTGRPEYGMDSYEKQFLDLQQRLFLAEQENQKRSRDLSAVLDELKRAVAEKRNAFENHTVEEIKWRVLNMTSKLPIQFTNIYMFLPHLLGHEDSLKPIVHYGHGRTGVSIVIGIPTVKRDKQSYLMDTLRSLFSELSAAEKQDCVVVVFIAEVNTRYVNELADNIKDNFPLEIQSGVLEIISPPSSFYPDFSNMKETFGDPKDRVKYVEFHTQSNYEKTYFPAYKTTPQLFQLKYKIFLKVGGGLIRCMSSYRAAAASVSVGCWGAAAAAPLCAAWVLWGGGSSWYSVGALCCGAAAAAYLPAESVGAPLASPESPEAPAAPLLRCGGLRENGRWGRRMLRFRSRSGVQDDSWRIRRPPTFKKIFRG
ncbi:unnamed protein product [Ranitomeya imitator]|uniref:MGAT4 conserved region domain-containing protein n=1 Tax=Ranitomeya imitator TaxID=111125 RepID=A0ABN9LKQ2_9NEOB|nr:unnamed protein product [Ranitomeya imitator]